jgi:hypothetical protein
MSGREVLLWEVLRFMRLGVDHAILKRKYNLSEEGLKDLDRQLAEAGFLEWTGEEFVVAAKRSIDTKDIVANIYSGATDVQLMEKYKLSSR